MFDGYWKLHVAFVLLALLLSIQLGRKFYSYPTHWLALTGAVLWIGGIGAMIFSLRHHMEDSRRDSVAVTRGFYGVLQVAEENVGTDDEYRSLYHGRINHGRQYQGDAYRRLATTYYSLKSGGGAVFELIRERKETPRAPLHVGAMVLGFGTIASDAE